MFKRISFAISGVLILSIALLSTNAHSIPFEGYVWVAHHIELEVETGDYFFIIDPKNIKIDEKSVNLTGFKIKKSKEELDFSERTKETNLLWYEIKKFIDQDYFEYTFKDINKNLYTGTAELTTFNNPVGDSSSAVPEPATILLVGSGLLGLAGISRKKLLKK